MIKDRSFYFDKTDNECDLATFRLNEDAVEKPVTVIAADYHKNRPDLLAYQLLDDWELWWAALRLNNIEDPFTDIERGTLLKMPERYAVSDYLNSRK